MMAVMTRRSAAMRRGPSAEEAAEPEHGLHAGGGDMWIMEAAGASGDVAAWVGIALPWAVTLSC